jgi:RNA polymerase sigma-70 factor (ECF subfamily)
MVPGCGISRPRPRAGRRGGYLASVDEPTRLAIDAGRGRQDAFAALVRAPQHDVWRLCAHLVDRQSADDLTQETYLRAARQLRRFRGDGSVRNWLLTIARRACATEIAARQRRRDASVDFAAAGPAAAPGDHTLQLELAMLLDELDPDRRAAFVLTQVLGCTYDETAQICGCPIGTVRSRVARARDDLIRLSGRTRRNNEGIPAPDQA